MRVTRQPCLALALIALGCDIGPPPTPFRPVADVKQLMSAVLEPAADVYWDAVGSITDSSGTIEIAPKTAEEWTAVRNSAVVVAESGNLLMMSPRAVDNADWMRMSLALIDVGQRAIAAAEAKDKTRVFDVGADVYNACTNCHAKYAVEQLRPNARE